MFVFTMCMNRKASMSMFAKIIIFIICTTYSIRLYGYASSSSTSASALSTSERSGRSSHCSSTSVIFYVFNLALWSGSASYCFLLLFVLVIHLFIINSNDECESNLVAIVRDCDFYPDSSGSMSTLDVL